MKLSVLFLCSLLLLVHSCQPPDCDHPDCGTCGMYDGFPRDVFYTHSLQETRVVLSSSTLVSERL